MVEIYLSNFDSTLLTCDPALFPGKNIPNIAPSNRIFPGKGRRDKNFILTYLDLKFFRTTAYFFRFWPFSGGKERSKLDQKCFGSVLFP